MSILAKKLYFDIYNLENDIQNKEQMILEYQTLFDEYILNYKEQNSSFADTYNEIDELHKKVVNKEFEKTIHDIEEQLKNAARASTDSDEPKTPEDAESADETINENRRKRLESITKNYRDIAKITHPDKTLSLDETTQRLYENYYKKATSFYENEELYGLMLINKLLGNNPFNAVFVDADIDNLKKKKEELEIKVSQLQQTFIWNFMSIEDEKELNAFISNHFKNMLNKMK